MSVFKKVKVVMLPTNEKVTKNCLLLCPSLGKYNNSWWLKLNKDDSGIQYTKLISQHLYFLSNEEIKEGDWQVHWSNDLNNYIISQHKLGKSTGLKVIATTDKSLNLPQPSQSFIEKYISEYNKGNKIEEVMVEYELFDNGWDSSVVTNRVHKIKVNLKDNTITIKSVKNSWSREEIKQILEMYKSDIDDSEIWNSDLLIHIHYPDINKWIEENL